MKRFYLLMLILFSIVALPAQAQFSWGIKGGANISSLHFSDLPETFSKSNITGFHIGPTIELIAPVVGLGFDASILYSQTGVEMGRQKIKNDYLDDLFSLVFTSILLQYCAIGHSLHFGLTGLQIFCP